MTDDIARELGELLEKATPGRWLYNGRMQRVEQDSHVHGRDYRPVASPYNANADADGALIAAARNHLPALLSSRAADRKRIEVLEETLRWFINDIDGKHTVMRDFDAAVERARAALAGGTDG